MIPEGWSEARLGDLGYTFGGLTGKSRKDFGTGSATFVTFMNVMANVVLSADGVEAVNVEPGEAQNHLRAGDVIFNGSSETPEEVGFGATVPETLEGAYLNSFCFGFRCYPDAALDATFLSYLTRSPVGRQVIRPMAQGSTRYNLAKTNLLNGLFSIPPLAEQQAIADALSDADALVEALDALIAKKRDIKQAAMQQLLTGRTRLVALDDAWDKACLGEVASFEAGTYLPSNRYQEGSVKVQGAGGQMGWTNSPNFFQPIVVIGRVGTIGEPRFHDGDCWVNNNAAALVPKGSVTAKYIYFVLQSLDFRRFTSTTAQPFLAVTDLLSFVILVPPLAEQVAMVKVLTDMETEIDALVAQREKAELVKQGMMQELLSGRVRLV